MKLRRGDRKLFGGSRQIFDMCIERVADSCGTGVPIMTLESDRGLADLEPFYAKMSDEQLNGYWERKNRTSNDGPKQASSGTAEPARVGQSSSSNLRV